MNRPLIALALVTLVASSCSTTARDVNNHWSERSVPPRIARYFTGYDASRDGASYRDFQWERKKANALTFRRHFLNHNPDNPHHEEVPSRFHPRPNHSILPNPLNYIHWEGLIFGFAIFGATGSYFPVPFDSILGTLEEGGIREFTMGIEETFTPIGVVTASFLHTWVSPGFEGIFGSDSDSAYARIVEVEEE